MLRTVIHLELLLARIESMQLFLHIVIGEDILRYTYQTAIGDQDVVQAMVME